jgi:carbonic anhydrase
VELETLLKSLNTTKIFNYEGSLTTPTCSEIVEWNVIVDPQPITSSQLNFFTRRWAGNNTFARGRGNNRVTQPIGDRLIYYYGGPAASTGAFIKAALSSLVVVAISVFA